LLGAYYKGKNCVQHNKQQELMLLIDYGTQLIVLLRVCYYFTFGYLVRGIVTCFRQIRLNITDFRLAIGQSNT